MGRWNHPVPLFRKRILISCKNILIENETPLLRDAICHHFALCLEIVTSCHPSKSGCNLHLLLCCFPERMEMPLAWTEAQGTLKKQIVGWCLPGRGRWRSRQTLLWSYTLKSLRGGQWKKSSSDMFFPMSHHPLPLQSLLPNPSHPTPNSTEIWNPPLIRLYQNSLL